MMSTQEGSSTASANTEFPSATHLVTLPVPSSETATLLIAHTTEFGRTPSATAMSTSPTAKPALYIWCGESNGDVPALSSISAAQPPHGSSSLLEEANVVDRSDLTSDQASQDMNPAELAALELPPTGALTREWAVAMTSARAGGSDKAKTGMATSLFRSNSDLAKPMASRLSKRFEIPQLFLSLSLPEHLLATIEGPYSGPEGGRALLLLEGALGRVIKDCLADSGSG